MIAANLYLLPEYEEIVAKSLTKRLNEDNFCQLYNLAILLGNETLLKAVRTNTCKTTCEDDTCEDDTCEDDTCNFISRTDLDFRLMEVPAFEDFFRNGLQCSADSAICR